ncbi:MAG: GNAT family N-acetyltransferase [Acidimicrobiales bacterium]|nr:GNAT family N-acetyltransferase [Acidimicrobiales bacterium]
MPDEDPYPEQWESDVVLADGSTAHVRPIRPDDRERLRDFHGRQSAESIYLRYFTPRPTLSESDLDRFTNVDYQDRMAFVAVLGDDLIAVARYDRWSGRDEAEVAFMVDDAHQGLGIGTVLLEFLAEAARQVGFRRFSAQVLPSNRKMLRVFRQAGFRTTSEFGDGVIEVMLDIEPTAEALAAVEARSHSAEVRSVARVLAPRSVAVIGAGREPGRLGHEVVVNLVAAGFTGAVYPVNPAADHVAGIPAVASVLDTPEPVDQAVIAVPAPLVADAVLECARARVQSLVIVSSGFRESGPEGAAAERDLVSLARRYGMRVVGPNCLGVINTDPQVRLHASQSPARPSPGPIGLLSQSGSLGTAILDHAESLDLGISTFVEAGNKADVSANDLLQYWEDDERTRLVLLHLESFGNARSFSRIVRRVGRQKPVVAVKSGAVMAGWAEQPWLQGATADALLAQMGVIRVDAIEAMFDVARVLLHQPVPTGRRVALVGNAGGPTRLAADACVGAGLTLASLGANTRDRLRTAMPVEGLADNPVDLTHRAGPDEYAAALEAVTADPEVDAVLVIYAPPLSDRTGEVIDAITATAPIGGKPVVATALGVGAVDLPSPGDGAVPSFTFPERAARALGAAAAYGAWRAEEAGEPPPLDGVDEERARLLVEEVLAHHLEGTVLGPADADALLAAFGIAVAPRRLAGSSADVVKAAKAIGFPVTLKATGLESLGKTEAAGVALDLHRPDEVRRAHRRMSDALGGAMVPALVQAMVQPGLDLSVGLHQHPAVGGVLSLGAGGAAGATGAPAVLRVLPLTDVDIERLLATAPLSQWLAACEPAVDRGALADLLARLSRLADDLPEAAEVVANPVIVSSQGAVVTDVRVRLAPWRRLDPIELRRL